MRVDQVATHTSYGTSLMTVLYSFLDAFNRDEWTALGIVVGIVFTVLTWVTNIYFQRQRNRILEQQKNGVRDEG
ncbi:lysis protein [Salmonella enterica subsp. diarizonae]|nr:lysis protein [Salmonella enterica subsp. diarizonae]